MRKNTIKWTWCNSHISFWNPHSTFPDILCLCMPFISHARTHTHTQSYCWKQYGREMCKLLYILYTRFLKKTEKVQWYGIICHAHTWVMLCNMLILHQCKAANTSSKYVYENVLFLHLYHNFFSYIVFTSHFHMCTCKVSLSHTWSATYTVYYLFICIMKITWTILLSTFLK